jgi:hypothetical protein
MQAQRRGRASQLDGVRQYVGVKSDREVAEMVGLTPSAVQMYRKKHGIAPSGITGRQAKPKPVARPAAAKVAPLPEPEKVAKTTPQAAWAWKVTIAPDQVRYVVAKDAAGAARLADAAGDVLNIERIGEGLAAA